MILFCIWDVIEFLAVPALLVIIGLLNSYPWQYYVISIGIYVALFAILEVICYFIFKAINKKYTPIIIRKLNRFFDRFSNNI